MKTVENLSYYLAVDRVRYNLRKGNALIESKKMEPGEFLTYRENASLTFELMSDTTKTIFRRTREGVTIFLSNKLHRN